jgi:hypothetical protein
MTTPYIEVRKTVDTTAHGRSPGARRPLPRDRHAACDPGDGQHHPLS